MHHYFLSLVGNNSNSNFSFGLEKDMIQHLVSVHNEKKPFVCQECFDGFKTKTSLKTHVENIHLKVKNAHCSICGASFYNKSMLRIHTHCVHKRIEL